jgi:hypothetical protein
MMILMDDHIGKHSAKGLRIDVQQTTINIPGGGVKERNPGGGVKKLLSCVFLLPFAPE